MSLAQIKEQIVLLITQIEDPNILVRLYPELGAVYKAEKGKDFWTELSPKQQKEIDLSLQQIKEKRTISDEDIRKASRQWLIK